MLHLDPLGRLDGQAWANWFDEFTGHGISMRGHDYGGSRRHYFDDYAWGGYNPPPDLPIRQGSDPDLRKHWVD